MRSFKTGASFGGISGMVRHARMEREGIEEQFMGQFPLSLSGVARATDTSAPEQMQIEAARADPAAFAPLYQRYLIPVFRYLRTQVGTDEEAADMTQEVFLQAMDALSAYRSRDVPFAAWLFRIARHDVADFHRRRRRMVAWNALPDIPSWTEDHDPEVMALRQEALTHLRTLLSELDPRKRELVALRYAAQLGIPEIAAVVGKSPAAVKKQLTRILQQLKEQYRGVDTASEAELR